MPEGLPEAGHESARVIALASTKYLQDGFLWGIGEKQEFALAEGRGSMTAEQSNSLTKELHRQLLVCHVDNLKKFQ